MTSRSVKREPNRVLFFYIKQSGNDSIFRYPIKQQGEHLMKLPTFTPTNSTSMEIRTIFSSEETRIDENYLAQVLSSKYGDIEQIIDYTDIKEFDKMIKNIVKVVRGSLEYRNYIGYLKQNFNLTECSFLSNLSTEDVSIELHHYPFSLYDITKVVMLHNTKSDIKKSTFKMAEEIVKIHYEGLVGLVPLSELAHELTHSGKLFIRQKNVFGNVSKFIETYKLGIDADLKERLTVLLNLESTNGNLIDFENQKIFDKRVTKLWTNVEKFPMLEQNSTVEEDDFFDL